MSKLINGMKSILEPKDITHTGMSESWNVVNLVVFWQIGLDFEQGCLTITPETITQPILKYVENHETKETDLDGWKFVFNTSTERPHNQFYISAVELNFETQTLIVSI